LAPCSSTPSKPAARAFRGRLCEGLDDRGDLGDVELARGRVDASGGQEEIASRSDGRRTDRHFTAAHVGMSDAAAMPYLAEDAPARRMDSVGDATPSGDLVIAVDARAADDAMSLIRHLHALGDDQTGGSALDVIVEHQIGRDTVLARTGPGHCRHQHAVGEWKAVQIEGSKEIGHRELSFVR
jgi:hypothetical protein